MQARFVVITRYRVDELDSWLAGARTALAPLVTQSLCLGGEISASVDDPQLAVIVTRWASVGDFRRAMSDFEVKMHTVPLLSQSIDEPTTFEVLHLNGPEGAADFTSARAKDADWISLGQAAAATVESRIPARPQDSV